MAHLRQELLYLRRKIAYLRQELSYLRRKIAYLQQELPYLPRKIAYLQQELPYLPRKIAYLQQELLCFSLKSGNFRRKPRWFRQFSSYFLLKMPGSSGQVVAFTQKAGKFGRQSPSCLQKTLCLSQVFYVLPRYP